MLVQLIGTTAPQRRELLRSLSGLFPQASIHLAEKSFIAQAPTCIIISYLAFLRLQEKLQLFIQSSSTTVVCFVFECPTPAKLIQAIEAGAQDGILHPFHLGLCRHRLQRLLASLPEQIKPITGKYFSLHPSTLQLCTDTIMVQLRPKEYHILSYFLLHSGQTIHRTQLLHQLWKDHHEVMHNTIDTHIKNIRKKLRIISAPAHIIAVYGEGYRLEEK